MVELLASPADFAATVAGTRKAHVVFPPYSQQGFQVGDHVALLNAQSTERAFARITYVQGYLHSDGRPVLVLSLDVRATTSRMRAVSPEETPS